MQANQPADNLNEPPPSNNAQPTRIPHRRLQRQVIFLKIYYSFILLLFGGSLITAIGYSYIPSYPVMSTIHTSTLDFADFRYPGSQLPARNIIHMSVGTERICNESETKSGRNSDDCSEKPVLRIGFLLRAVTEEKIMNWRNVTKHDAGERGLKKDNGKMIADENELRKTDIYEEFIALLDFLNNDKKNLSPLSTSHFPKTVIKPTPRFIDVLDGTAEYLSSVKTPWYGTPKLCIMYSTTRKEHLKYYARIYSFPTSSDRVEKHTKKCDIDTLLSWPYNINSASAQSQQLQSKSQYSCHNPDLLTYEKLHIELIGNSEFDWFTLSSVGRLVYKRKDDVVLFRVADTPGKSGKLLKSELGFPISSKRSQLLLLELYNPTPEKSSTILSIQARKNDLDKYEFYMNIYYKREKLESWIEYAIFTTTASPNQISEEFLTVSSDQSHLYFLKNPVVGTGNKTQTVSFFFLNSIFTIDYAPHQTSEPHGYYLQPRQHLNEHDSHELMMTEVWSETTRTTLIARNKLGELYVFRRELIQEIEVTGDGGNPVAPAVETSTNQLQFQIVILSFQDLFLELIIRLIRDLIWPWLRGANKSKASKVVHNPDAVIKREYWSQWELDKMWTSLHTSDKKAQTLLDKSVLPLEFLQKLSPVDDPQLLFVLESDGTLQLLDLKRSQEGSNFWKYYVLRKWDMILLMLAIVIAFVINELAPFLIIQHWRA